MTRIEELNDLPESLKREILDYAEYLLLKYRMRTKDSAGGGWADVRDRGRSLGQTASETVMRMREEHRW